MSNKIQSVRGMHDILPEATPAWQMLELTLVQLMDAYGYREIRLPHVESSELFCRSIGDVTDIVEKEMYTFADRNGDKISLRPEATASCVRAGIEHGLFHNQVQRLWTMGSMFRHERPQKGRYREFHQFDVEAFGMEGPDIDAEMIMIGHRLWMQLGLSNIHLEINSLGTPAERLEYRQKLVQYFQQHHQQLDEDSQRRLLSNPMRILDSKNPDLRDIIAKAPLLSDHLGEVSHSHFNGLKSLLDKVDIPYTINPRLVRGLDYYTHTVFEWVSDALGAQGTVCAGGRYDHLVEQLGGKPTPAIGFAIGLERLLSLLAELDDWQSSISADIYIVSANEDIRADAMQMAEEIRDQLPELGIICHCGAAGLKSQMKQADRSGAELALILGEDELRDSTITVKSLRDNAEQQVFERSKLIEYLTNYFYTD